VFNLLLLFRNRKHNFSLFGNVESIVVGRPLHGGQIGTYHFEANGSLTRSTFNFMKYAITAAFSSAERVQAWNTVRVGRCFAFAGFNRRAFTTGFALQLCNQLFVSVAPNCFDFQQSPIFKQLLECSRIVETCICQEKRCIGIF